MWNKVVSPGRWSAFALSISLAGCTAIYDCKYELGQKIRTGNAWHEFDGCNEQCFTCDYRCGWKAGYYDVITGGDGRPPLIAPQKYWQPPVFFEHDPSRRDDWYCGYQDGVACAQGQPDHHYLQTFLPDNCMTMSSEFQPEFGGDLVTHPEGLVREAPAAESPMPVSGGSGLPENAQPNETPATPEEARPAEPAPKGQDYEKDPEQKSTQAEPHSRNLSKELVANANARNPLLDRLVLNAMENETDHDPGVSP